jgi:predicted nuclease of predicted toxin-antitoxin system
MKLLLDENLPKKLKYRFSSNFSVQTVSDLGWQGKQNGELLSSMIQEELQVLITSDKNLRFQQNLENLNICVVILMTKDNRYETVKDFVIHIEELLLSNSTFSYYKLSL